MDSKEEEYCFCNISCSGGSANFIGSNNDGSNFIISGNVINSSNNRWIGDLLVELLVAVILLIVVNLLTLVTLLIVSMVVVTLMIVMVEISVVY